MAVPELQYFPAERKAIIRFAGVDVTITEDDAGYVHADVPHEVAKVNHGTTEVVNNLPEETVWAEEAEANAPVKSAEDKIREALDGLNPGATREEIVQLAATEALKRHENTTVKEKKK